MVGALDKISFKTREALCLMVILGALFASRWIMLNKSPWPNGLDGAFYAMEFRSFAERGHLENRDLSPLFRVGGLLTRVTGDAVKSVKLCAALLCLLLTGGVYFLSRSLFPESRDKPLLGALLSALSPALTVMCLNYLNNLAGLGLGLFALGWMVRFIRGRRVYRLILGLTFAAAAVLHHRVGAAYLLLILLWYGAKRMWGGGKAGRMVLLILACLPLPALFFLRQEYLRFSGSFAFGPGLPLLSPLFRERLPLAVTMEISLYFLFSYALLFRDLFRRRENLSPAWLAPFLFFPFWNLSVLDMGYRMLLSALPAGIILTLYLLPDRLPLPRRAGAALLLFLCLTPRLYNPLDDPPYALYHRVVEPIELPMDSLVIAHLGLNHIYTYDKDFRDALNYVPDFPVADNRIWRIARGAPADLLQRLYPEETAAGEIQILRGDYLLIREDLWQEYLAWEDEPVRESLNNWYNPHKIRPAYIR
ncbi:MAG: hypothetical protein PQJ60_14160 [Spirochaetales bacterium]|nr:hypothetical protein [Spirochaetales bacterium]